MTVFKKIILFCSVLICSAIHAAENKSVAIDRKQVEQFFNANKISYSVVRDTYAKLKYLEKQTPYTLIDLVKKVHNDQLSFSDDTFKWLRQVGLIDGQGSSGYCSIVHADVKKIIQKLAYLENDLRAYVSHPGSIFKNWLGD